MKKLNNASPVMIELDGANLELNIWERKSGECEFSLFDGNLPVISGPYDPDDEGGSLDSFLSKVNSINQAAAVRRKSRAMPSDKLDGALGKVLSVSKVGGKWRRAP